MSISRPVSPRDYAAAILAESALERRQQLMERCPEDWRAIVEDYVKTTFAKVVAYRKYRAGRIEQSNQKPTAAPRRDAFYKPEPSRRSEPNVGNAAISKLRAAIGKGAV